MLQDENNLYNQRKIYNKIQRIKNELNNSHSEALKYSLKLECFLIDIPISNYYIFPSKILYSSQTF